MPRVDVVVKTKDGQAILLTEGDRIEKTVTIECNSQRCASRHGQDKPQEVSLVDGQPMPEAGRQWLSLILPETSPQYTPLPPNFCGPACVRDYLIYDYIAPSSAGVEEVQKTDSVEYHVDKVPATLPPHSGQILKVVEPLAQADGVGE